MTTALQVCQFGKDKQRIEVIDGKEWWCVKDACDILELINVTEVTRAIPPVHLRSSEVDIINKEGWRTKRNMLFVDESGLNQIIFRSYKPIARSYQEWVFGTVLPTIRKTGSYSLKSLTQLDIMQQAIDVLKNHEREINELRGAVVTMRADVESIHQAQAKMLSAPAQSLTKGQVLRAQINQYGREHKFQRDDYQLAWNKLYGNLYYRYGINIGSMKERGGYTSKLAAAEANGCVGSLLSLATELYPIKSQSVLGV